METNFVDPASMQIDSEQRFLTDVPGWIKTQRLDEGGAGPTRLRSRFLARHLVVRPAPAEYWVDLRVEVAHDQGRWTVDTFGGSVGPSERMHPEDKKIYLGDVSQWHRIEAAI